LLGKSAA
jgi:hypothetical protein